MAQHLSESPEAKQWLEQFSERDRSSARLLLDSLTLVSRDETMRVLEQTLVDFVEAVFLHDPISLVAVRKTLSKEESYFSLHTKHEKPKLVTNRSFPGSEALIANLFKNLVRLDRNKFLDHANLVRLKNKKCRRIIFVDDVIGSGDRVSGFIKLYTRHPTIRSWLSYGLIRIFVIAYSGTELGVRRVKALKYVSAVRVGKSCPTFDDASWSDKERDAVESLCRMYSPRDQNPLGHKETGGLLVFEHSVPNNTPPILWANEGGWRPLFPDRTVPSRLTAYFGRPPSDEELRNRLARLGQTQLARGEWLNVADPQIRKVILVLSSLQRSRSTRALLQMTGLSLPDLEAIISLCEQQKLLLPSRRLTKRGHQTLEHARSIGGRTKPAVATNPSFYYPDSLRRAPKSEF